MYGDRGHTCYGVLIERDLLFLRSKISEIVTLAPDKVSDNDLKQGFGIILERVNIGIEGKIKHSCVVLHLSHHFEAEGVCIGRSNVDLKVKHSRSEQHGKDQRNHSFLCRVRQNFADFRFAILSHVIL
jgi:hypothetical protein